MSEESGERGFARLALALIDIVHDIVGEASKHPCAIAGVEGGVIAFDQREGGGAVHAISLRR